MNQDDNIEYLLREGLIQTEVAGDDFFKLASTNSGRKTKSTASRTREYAIKVSDFIASLSIPSTASTVIYDPTISGLTAINVQSAIDEVNTNLNDHILNPTGAHTATAISYDPTVSGLVAINVQAAIDELVVLIGSAGGETLAQTLIIGNTTGPTDIVLSDAGFGIGSVAGDYLYMNSGNIELVADYNNYSAGFYASASQAYAALFFDGWGGAYEGGSNAALADPRGSYASIYTSEPGFGGLTNRLQVTISDNSIKTSSSTGLIMCDVTLDGTTVDAFDAFTNKKAGLLLADGSGVSTGVIFGIVINSEASNISTGSAYTSVISSNNITTFGSNYSSALASVNSTVGSLGDTLFQTAVFSSNGATISALVNDSSIISSNASSISPTLGGTVNSSALLATNTCSIERSATNHAIIASANIRMMTAGLSNVAVIASSYISWGTFESNTLYTDTAQVLNSVIIRDGVPHATVAGQVQLYLGVAGGNRAVFAETDGGDVIKLYKQILTNTTGGTAGGSLVDVTSAGVSDPAKVNDNFTELWTVLSNNGLVAPI